MRKGAKTNIVLNINLVNVVGFFQRIREYLYWTIFKAHIL